MAGALSDSAAADCLEEICHDEMKHGDAFKETFRGFKARVASEHDVRAGRLGRKKGLAYSSHGVGGCTAFRRQ